MTGLTKYEAEKDLDIYQVPKYFCPKCNIHLFEKRECIYPNCHAFQISLGKRFKLLKQMEEERLKAS